MTKQENRQSKSDLPLGSFVQTPISYGFILVALGVFLREQFSLLWSILVFLALSSVLYFILHWRKKFNLERKLLWGLSSLIVLLGISLHTLKIETVAVNEANCKATSEWQPIHLRGHVVSIPKFRPDKSKFRTSAQSPDEQWLTAIDVRYEELILSTKPNEELIPSIGVVRIVIPGRHRQYLPGDQVECWMKWRRIPPPSNPGEQDLAGRLRQQGIFTQGSAKNVSQVQHVGWPQYWNLNRYLGKLAMAGDRAIERFVPFGQAPLASALVLGQRDQIEWKLSESLLETGTIHMLAISGMHVEMVALSIGVLCLLMRMPQRLILVIVCTVVIGYTFLCGANAPVLRAMFAVMIVSFARFFGFTTNPYNLLSLAALSIIALRTDHLWDTGTQLSFLAVAVLIYVASEGKLHRISADPLDELLEATETGWQRKRRQAARFCKDSLKVSAWVWLITTPIVFSTFHVVSPVAILMNLLLLIPLWIGLISGLCIMIFGPWFSWLGSFLGLICGTNLAITEFAIELASLIPYSHWWSHSPPMWWVFGFYLLAILLFMRSNHSLQSRRTIFCVLLLYLAVGCIPWYGFLPKQVVDRWIYFQPTSAQGECFAMTFIDVGHGTGVLMELPNGENWLYDSGRMGDPDRAFYPIANTLWHLRIRSIDQLFISHADSDHFNAIPGILKRFAIQQVNTTQQALESEDLNLQQILKNVRRKGIPIKILQTGDSLQSDQTLCSVLHPSATDMFATDNAASMSILVECFGRKLFLPGDLEGPGTIRLLRNQPTKIDVLMAPHHGSLSDAPGAILSWSKPDHVVISGGPRARRQAVLSEYSQQGAADVWVTDRDHAIRIEVQPDGTLSILNWQNKAWRSIDSVGLPSKDSEDDEATFDNAF